MSWAATATSVIDVTPRAATVKAAKSNAFFPDESSQTIQDESDSELEMEDGTKVWRRAPAQRASTSARQHTSSSKPSANNFLFTSMTTNTDSTHVRHPSQHSRTSSQAFALSNDSSSAQLLPLHVQEALKSEVTHLKRELARFESKLTDKDASLQKASDSYHKLEKEKLAEQARSRQVIKELRKTIAESEARLAFFQKDFTSRKEQELAQVQKHNSAILDHNNMLLESIGNTIKKSSSSVISQSQVEQNPNFSGASVGSTHEDHLKNVLEDFKQERLGWDKSKQQEIRSLRQQHAAELEAVEEQMKKVKGQYATQYATWKKQHAALMSEIDYLSEYITKLTFLFEEIDRGVYPVSLKHGITTWNIPETKRSFLQIGTTNDGSARSAMLEKKLRRLKNVFQAAKIPWDPELIHTNQSFTEDRKHREARLLLQSEPMMQLPPSVESDEADTDPTPPPLSFLSDSSHDEKESTPYHTHTQHSSIITHPPPSSSHTDELHSAFESELTSNATVQYIKQLEEERDRYKHALSLETRKKLELHSTLTSQNRLIQGNELFKRSKHETDQRRSSITANSQRGSTSSSMAQLIAAAQQTAGSGIQPNGDSHSSNAKLNHSSATASSKARDIIQASTTMAFIPQAGKLGVQVGYETSQAQGLTSVDGGVGLTAGQQFAINNSSSMSVLTTPSRVVDYTETTHTNGAYKSSNVRPSSAAVYHASRPMSAISAVSSYTNSAFNSRPSSAFVPTSSAAMRGHYSHQPVVGIHHMPSASAPPSAALVASFAKPLPMHIGHGNASAQLFTQQVAKKSHQEARDALNGPSSSSLDSTDVTHRSHRSRPTSASSSGHTSVAGSPALSTRTMIVNKRRASSASRRATITIQ